MKQLQLLLYPRLWEKPSWRQINKVRFGTRIEAHDVTWRKLQSNRWEPVKCKSLSDSNCRLSYFHTVGTIETFRFAIPNSFPYASHVLPTLQSQRSRLLLPAFASFLNNDALILIWRFIQDSRNEIRLIQWLPWHSKLDGNCAHLFKQSKEMTSLAMLRKPFIRASPPVALSLLSTDTK